MVKALLFIPLLISFPSLNFDVIKSLYSDFFNMELKDNGETKVDENSEVCYIDENVRLDDERLQNGNWRAVDNINSPHIIRFGERGNLTLVYSYGALGVETYSGNYTVTAGSIVLDENQGQYYPIEVNIRYPNGMAQYDALLSIAENDTQHRNLDIAFLDITISRRA